MKIGKILSLILLSLSSSLFASLPKEILDFENSLYLLQNEVSSFSGKIEIPELSAFFETKLALSEVPHLEIEFNFQKKDNLFNVVISGDLDQKYKDILRDALYQKRELILGGSLLHFIDGYSLKFQKNFYKAEAKADFLGDEKLIFLSKEELKLIEKKPSGTITSIYHYEKIKNKLILRRVQQTSYEGTQKVSLETKIDYKKMEGLLVPFKITSEITQGLTGASSLKNENERKLIEIIEISNIRLKLK